MPFLKWLSSSWSRHATGSGLTGKLCWQLVEAKVGGRAEPGAPAAKESQARSCLGPGAHCRHLEGGMFTWYRTSVLGCRTDWRGGHVLLKLPYDQDDNLLFASSLLRGVFQHKCCQTCFSTHPPTLLSWVFVCFGYTFPIPSNMSLSS